MRNKFIKIPPLADIMARKAPVFAYFGIQLHIYSLTQGHTVCKLMYYDDTS